MTLNCEKCGFPLVEGHKCPVDGVGMRHNAGKARTDLIPAIVLMELGKHYEYGARKYAPNNWVAGFPYSDTYASLTRHLFAWWAGERNDPENGHHHLIAVIWNAVALLYFELFPDIYSGFDDRVIPHTKSMAEINPLPEKGQYRSTSIKIPAQEKPQRWVQDGPDDKRDFRREY